MKKTFFAVCAIFTVLALLFAAPMAFADPILDPGDPSGPGGPGGPGGPDKPPVTEYQASDILTSADITSVFGDITVGASGQLQATMPAYTKFTVSDAWEKVVKWDTTEAYPGDVVETENEAQNITFWPHEITEFTANQLLTSTDIKTAFNNGTQGSDGQFTVSVPAYTKFTVADTWSKVVKWDNSEAAPGDTVETGNQARTVVFWPHEITLIDGSKLITSADLKETFGVVTQGSDGQLEVTMPAYSKFTVGDAWAKVVRWDNTEAKPGDVVQTSTEAKKIVFWPHEVAVIDAHKLRTAGDIMQIFGSVSPAGDKGQVTTTVPAYTKFTVADTWVKVVRWDNTEAQPGDTVETGYEAKKVTFYPHEITTIPASALMTSNDVIKTFGGVVGDQGQIEVLMPKYTKFTVSDAWEKVVKWDKTSVLPGGVVQTEDQRQIVVFWPRKATVVPADELKTPADVIKKFGGTKNNKGEIEATLPAYTKFTVGDEWEKVILEDGTVVMPGEVIETGNKEQKVIFVPKASTIPADQLVTVEDVIRLFGNGTKGENGEVEVTIPAHTKFVVHEAWALVKLWDNTEAHPGDTVDTGDQNRVVKFYPDQEYWDAKNTIPVANDADVEKYLDKVEDNESDIGLWDTYKAKDTYAGKIFSFGENLAAVSVDTDNRVSEAGRLRVTATSVSDVQVAATGTNTVRIAKKADLATADVSTFAAMQKVSPVELEPEQTSCGDWKVEFYVALTSWQPVIAGDLIKVAPNTTRVQEENGVYTSTDGHYIGYVTMYLKTVNGPTSDRGGGGGGCDTGLGVWALAALSLLCFKKSHR